MSALDVFFVLFLTTHIENVFLEDDVKILKLTEDISEHKKYENKSAVCDHRHIICEKDKTKICAMRFNNESFEYKLFDNTCYLFLNNLCEYLGHEFHIVEPGFCNDLSSMKIINRRMQTNTTTLPVTINNVNVTNRNGSRDNSTIDNGNGGNATKLIYKQLLRHLTHPTTVKYDIEDAFDSHPCPRSCPNLYSPVCMSVNRGEGKYFKYFTFYNHCFSDMYYCANYKDLGPAPSREYEDVQVSPLGWSFCGAYRYLQFARYSEVLSTMGHYGWLAGPHRYSHIMKPHERIPGYGK